MSVTIKFRRGTSSEWTTNGSTILSSGEPGFEIDTGRVKIGDGITAWSGLYYASIIPTGLIAGNNVNINLGANGSTATIGVSGAVQQSQSLVTTVFNETGSTLSKMTAVYIDGGHGDLPTIQKAIATSDMTSAGTYGLVYEDIDNMEIGQVVVFGSLSGINTDPAHGGIAGATEGSVLYLSPTVSGAITTTKPYAPHHVVAIGTVVRVHQNQGVIEVRVQNGFELEELHNVAVTGATNGQFLQYNSGSGLWVPSSSGNFTYISATTGTMSGLYVRVSPDNNFVNLNNALTIDGDNFLKIYGTTNELISTEDNSIYGFNISAGAIDNTPIGGNIPNNGTFTDLKANSNFYVGDAGIVNAGVDLGNYYTFIDNLGNLKTYKTAGVGFNGSSYNILLDGNGGFSGGAALTIDGEISATSGTITNNLTVGGNLTVNGSTIVANVDTITIEDPIVTLGLSSGNVVVNDTLDRGLALVRSTGLTAFMGWDSSASQFIMLSSGVATNNSGNYNAGTYGDLRINNLSANSGNFTTALTLNGSGLQTVLTNPVTGTGIANHIAYWNSSSGIVADSGQLYWNSNINCLGIGTTSPLCTLDVHGYIQAGFGINGKVVITDDQYGGELGILTNNEEALAIKYNDGSFRYGESLPGASDGIIVSSNKNIGIGTESPSAKLHVIGTGLFSNSIGINTNTTSVGATPYALLVDGDVSIGSGNAGRTLSVWSNNSTKRTVIKNVNGTSFLTYSIGSQNLNIGGPQPTDSPFNTINYYAGNPTPSTASHRFHVSVDGTGIAPIAVITNSGLGIGTTSPSYTLDVSGTIGVSGIARFNNDIYMLDTTKRISWDNGTEYIGRQGDSIIIGTQSTTKILVNSAGNVGIGTESPGATLDVRGSAIFNEAGADVDFRVEGDTDANLVFVDASTDRVGIGTSTPSDKLNIVGNISAGTLSNTQGKFIAYGSASQPNLLFEGFGTDGTARISTNSGANRQLKIENDGASNTLGVYIEGDVGIGTTTPGYKLQVAGSFGATTKSFRIDHPSKKGYSLEYGSLESPYHGVRLTGRDKVVKGVGTVQLPDYLKDLIHDDESITIQLTNYKHGKTLYVSNIDLQNDQFIVKADRAKSLGELEFFWTLTGVRKDVEDLVVEKRN